MQNLLESFQSPVFQVGILHYTNVNTYKFYFCLHEKARFKAQDAHFLLAAKEQKQNEDDLMIEFLYNTIQVLPTELSGNPG